MNVNINFFYQGTASLVLEGTDKMVTLSGRQETPWIDIITFRGDSITYRFEAETDGEHPDGGSLMEDSGDDDWGFRFTVRTVSQYCREHNVFVQRYDLVFRRKIYQKDIPGIIIVFLNILRTSRMTQLPCISLHELLHYICY